MYLTGSKPSENTTGQGGCSFLSFALTTPSECLHEMIAALRIDVPPTTPRPVKIRIAQFC